MTDVNNDLIERALDEIENISRTYFENLAGDDWSSAVELGSFMANCDNDNGYEKSLLEIPVATNTALEIAHLDTQDNTKNIFIRTFLATKVILENPEISVINLSDELLKWNNAQLKFKEDSNNLS